MARLLDPIKSPPQFPNHLGCSDPFHILDFPSASPLVPRLPPLAKKSPVLSFHVDNTTMSLGAPALFNTALPPYRTHLAQGTFKNPPVDAATIVSITQCVQGSTNICGALDPEPTKPPNHDIFSVQPKKRKKSPSPPVRKFQIRYRVHNLSRKKRKCLRQYYQIVGINGAQFYQCRNRSDPNLPDEKLRDTSL